jgi:N-methylhydantoinase A
VARSLPQQLDRIDFAAVDLALAEMEAQAQSVVADGAGGRPCGQTRTCLARYCGQGYEIPVPLPLRPLAPGDEPILLDAFERAYRDQYGGVTIDLPIEILTWRLSVWTQPDPAEPVGAERALRPIAPAATRPVFDPAGGEIREFGLFDRAALMPGDRIAGPALIAERETTTVVSPAFDAIIDAQGFIVLTRNSKGGRA